ncbi:MAG: integrase core domain-containing protein [Planctomycetaceae bacterium]|nr:integrase core domain-containing protein [Planctomycetaceae bacterium]
MGIHHVQGRVRCPAVNGKIERFFRTFKLWLRAALLPINPRGVQKRLDRFATWYNGCRGHQALKGRTPDEAWQKKRLPKPVTYRAGGEVVPMIDIRRLKYRGDPNLPLIKIKVKRRRRAA